MRFHGCSPKVETSLPHIGRRPSREGSMKALNFDGPVLPSPKGPEIGLVPPVHSTAKSQVATLSAD
jgi:hypothetical protein